MSATDLSLVMAVAAAGRDVWPTSLVPQASLAPLSSGSALGSAGAARKAAVVLLAAGAGTGLGRKHGRIPAARCLAAAPG